MNDRVALSLGAVVIGALLLDWLGNGGGATLFIVRKLADLIYFVAFWRH